MHSFRHHHLVTYLALSSFSLLPVATASAQSGPGASSGRVQPAKPLPPDVETKPVQTLTLEPPLTLERPVDTGSWCSTPAVMEILARAINPLAAPALEGTITAIDLVAQTVTITLAPTHTTIIVPATQLTEEEHDVQAADLKAGDSVFLWERGDTTPVFGDTLSSVSATTPLTLNIFGSAQQRLTLRASQIQDSPTDIRLGDFATVKRGSAAGPSKPGLRPESVIITKPEQVLFTRIKTFKFADVAVGQGVTITQPMWSANSPQLAGITVRVARSHLAPP